MRHPGANKRTWTSPEVINSTATIFSENCASRGAAMCGPRIGLHQMPSSTDFSAADGKPVHATRAAEAVHASGFSELVARPRLARQFVVAEDRKPSARVTSGE